MGLASKARSLLLASSAIFLIAACTQGEEIASPGAMSPGTGGGGAGGGGGTGGGGTGTTSDTCPSGFTTLDPVDLPGTTEDQTVCSLSGTILTDLTLPFVDNNNDGLGVAYRIDGRVNVGVDIGFDGAAPGGDAATLTIEPGVVLFGETGSDYMVVNRGSRLIADGDVNAPIVMTSLDDLESGQVDRPNSIGEWGGLVILGRAPISECMTGTFGTPSCSNEIEGVTAPAASFGGGEAGDNSGILRYFQVRYAGNPVSADNELNGISFGGVGSGTIVDFVQVHNNSDDGIEMFGGTANLRHIVLTGNDDDSLDTDFGWNGNVQYVVVAQRDGRGDNGFEMSNAGDAALPTDPTIANFTIVSTTRAASPGRGIRLNTGHVGRFINGVIEDSTEECIRWDSTAGDGDATYDGYPDDPGFFSVSFDCPTLATDPLGDAAVAADANNQTGGNSITSNFQSGTMEEAPFATAFDLTTISSFFDDTDYLGAFGPDDTETNNWATGWTFALFTDPGCPAGTNTTGITKAGKNVCEVPSGAKTTDLTLTRNNHYELLGRVDIGVDVGFDGTAAGGVAADLIIEPGTTIFGNNGSDYLIVNRGSRMFANGTVSNPVVMTSEQDLDTPANMKDTRLDNIGEWGGLVILGQAPISECMTGTFGTPSCSNEIEGVTAPAASFGGGDAADDSGRLTYLQVKFAGNPISADNELNGISFGGVGSTTVVDFVQVHNNSDDGIEMFGGTADLKHIVLTGNDDDSLDTDFGWNGDVQFVIVKQRDGRGDNGFEMSNAGDSALPTDPTIANFTIVSTTRAASPGRGIRLNTGHVGQFINGVVTDSTEACIRWDSTAGDGDATYDGYPDDPAFEHSLFDCPTLATDPLGDAAVAADPDNTSTTSVALINGFINDSAVAGRPAHPDLSGTFGSFFTNTGHIGAVENSSDDWWADWACGLAADDC